MMPIIRCHPKDTAMAGVVVTMRHLDGDREQFTAALAAVSLTKPELLGVEAQPVTLEP